MSEKSGESINYHINELLIQVLDIKNEVPPRPGRPPRPAIDGIAPSELRRTKRQKPVNKETLYAF